MPYTTKGRICVTSSIISPIFSFDYLPVVDSYTCRLYQMYAGPKSPHPNWTHSQHLVLYLLPASFQNLILLLTDIRSVDYYATISDESFVLCHQTKIKILGFHAKRNWLSIIMIFRMKDIRICMASKIKIPS